MKKLRIVLLALLLALAISIIPIAPSVFGGWEARTGIYGIEVDGDLKQGSGPFDWDDPKVLYPDVEATVAAIQHCNSKGELTPRTFADDTRTVEIGNVTYVYALHYYRTSFKVRTRADVQTQPSIMTETNRPHNYLIPAIDYGKAISPTVWLLVEFEPWDAIDGAEERWVGIMTVQVLDTEADQEGDLEADAGWDADPGVNPGAQLTMYDSVQGNTFSSQNWEGVAVDADVPSVAAVKVTPRLEPGYRDVMGGFLGIQLLDVQPIDVYVSYDVIIEVLVLGEVPQTGTAPDWDPESGRNQTVPQNFFDWMNNVLNYWAGKFNDLTGWFAGPGALMATVLIPVTLIGITAVALYWFFGRPKRGD